MIMRGRKSQSDLQLIGSAMRKIEGLDKSTGRAVYTDDIALPGMLYGKILRSPLPHARIASIDTTLAEALEGVHGVITGRDMPTAYGIIPWTPDEYPLCVDRVRYIGDGVAAVAAIDEDTALRALELIRVEYEELPACLDPHEALAADGSTSVRARRPQGGVERQHHEEGRARVRRGGRADERLARGRRGRVLLRGHDAHPYRAALRDRALGRRGSTDRLVGDAGAALPAPGARSGARDLPGPGPCAATVRRGRVRRQERAVRSRVLRGQAGDGDRAAGEDPLHARRGLLCP